MYIKRLLHLPKGFLKIKAVNSWHCVMDPTGVGLSMILLLSSVNTMLQTIAEEDKRGRVMSFYAMALMGTTPIGNLITGTVASGIGIRYTLLIIGTITILSGIWFGMNLKTLRKFVRPIYVSKGILQALPTDIA